MREETIKSNVIVASRAEFFRMPATMAMFAGKIQEYGSSANAIRDCITFTVWDWHESGGTIETHLREVLDIERMERTGEALVRSMEGNIISLEKDVPLVRLDDAFRENTRRTLARFFAKSAKPTVTRVDRRLLPLMFWVDVSIEIMARRAELIKTTV